MTPQNHSNYIHLNQKGNNQNTKIYMSTAGNIQSIQRSFTCNSIKLGNNPNVHRAMNELR